MFISKEFIRYCLVGVVNTIAGIGSAYFCLNVVKTSYLLATTVAYIVGIMVSFSLNKIFTFKNKDTHYIVQFFKFVASMLPSYVISYYLGWLLAREVLSLNNVILFASKFSLFLNMDYPKFIDNVAVIVSMMLYLALGFAVNKFFIFAKKK
ncbi:MAG: GtrA family protein [Candidatus Gastranaerophilales bacterium]|nr:GtrA family protein [Candidatus Gastranaerophilales bacterium]